MSVLKALKIMNPEVQDKDAFASAFVPTGDGTQIEEGPDAAGNLITPRFQGRAGREEAPWNDGQHNDRSDSHHVNDSQKGLTGKEGDPNLRDASNKLRIGMQELSFIRKEGSHHPGNISDFFIDSFLQDKDIQLDCNIEDDNNFMRGALEENLIKSLDPDGLFKDVEA